MRCPHCGSENTRKATVAWQCLSCNRDWLAESREARQAWEQHEQRTAVQLSIKEITS